MENGAICFCNAFPAPYLATQAVGGEKDGVAVVQQVPSVISVVKINPTTVEVLFSNQQRMTLDFYGDNIFRVFQDNNGGILRDPEAKPEAKILVSRPRKDLTQLAVKDDAGSISVSTGKVKVEMDKKTALMKVTNLQTGTVVLEEAKPAILIKKESLCSGRNIHRNTSMAGACRTDGSRTRGKPSLLKTRIAGRTVE